MRGDLTVKPEKKSGEPFFVVTGSWAPSAEALASGEGSAKFQYRAKAPSASAEIPPATMKCKGHFFVKEEGQEEPSKIVEKNVQLTFTKRAAADGAAEADGAEDESTGANIYALEGTGENQYGEFALEGTLKVVGSTGKLRCSKAYDAAHEEEASEESEDGEGMDEGLDEDELADLRADAMDTLGVHISAEPVEASSSRKRRKHGGDGGGGGGGGNEEPRPTKIKKKEQDKLEAVATAAAASVVNSKPELWQMDALQAMRAKVDEVAADAARPVPEVLEVLTELGSRTVNVELLRETGLGKAMKPLKKHADPDVAGMAAKLVVQWRTAVQQETGEGN